MMDDVRKKELYRIAMRTKGKEIYNQKDKPESFKSLVLGESDVFSIFWGVVFCIPIIAMNQWLFDGEFSLEVPHWDTINNGGSYMTISPAFALGVYAFIVMFDKANALKSIMVIEFVNRYFIGEYWGSDNSIFEAFVYAVLTAYAMTFTAQWLAKIGIEFKSHYQCISEKDPDLEWWKRNKSVSEFFKGLFIGSVCALSGAAVVTLGFYVTTGGEMTERFINFGLYSGLAAFLTIFPVYLVFAVAWFSGIGNRAKGRVAISD